MIDPFCLFDNQMGQKENGKQNEYKELKDKVGQLRKLKKVKVIPVVIGALETLTERLSNCIEKMNLTQCRDASGDACLEQQG